MGDASGSPSLERGRGPRSVVPLRAQSSPQASLADAICDVSGIQRPLVRHSVSKRPSLVAEPLSEDSATEIAQSLERRGVRAAVRTSGLRQAGGLVFSGIGWVLLAVGVIASVLPAQCIAAGLLLTLGAVRVPRRGKRVDGDFYKVIHP